VTQRCGSDRIRGTGRRRAARRHRDAGYRPNLDRECNGLITSAVTRDVPVCIGNGAGRIMLRA
jgi:hypothetical protein